MPNRRLSASVYARIHRTLILKVKDNGSGRTSEAETREGFGFVNLRARVKKLKGSLDIRTALGRGTSIVVSVPVGVSG